MPNIRNVWKLYRALTLKEYGYREEADDLITEIIHEEVEDTVVTLETIKKDETNVCNRNRNYLKYLY